MYFITQSAHLKDKKVNDIIIYDFTSNHIPSRFRDVKLAEPSISVIYILYLLMSATGEGTDNFC